MRWLDSLSPVKLAALGGIGAGMVLFAIVRASWQMGEHLRATSSLCVMVIAGYALMAVMELRLHRWIEAGRWTDAELQLLRRIVLSRLVTAMHFVPLVAGVVFFIRASALGGAALFPLGMLAFLYFARLGSMVRPRDAGTLDPDWSTASPVQSARWGEAVVAPDDRGLGSGARV